MIGYWKYDDGKPIWSDVLGDYIGEPRRASWRCTIYKRDPDAARILHWLEANLVKDDQFDMTHRFNSGDPAMFVEIYDKDAAALFYMTWIADNG